VVEKRSASQQRKMDELRAFIRTVEHVKKLVSELDSSRAARAQIIENICSGIARELSQLRHRAMAANVGTLADTAGALAVMASRGGGIAMKIRGLTEGVSSMLLQLDQALKHVMSESSGQENGSSS
jgi:hypothetical protein